MFSLSRVGTADNLRISKKTLNRFNIYTHPFTPAATSLVLIKKRQLKQKEQPCGSKPKVLQLRILSQTASNDRVRGCKLRQQRSNLCPSSSSQSWSWTLPPHPATAKSHPQPSLNSSRPVLKPFLLLTSAKPCGNKIHHQARCQLGKPKPFLVLLSCEEGAEASRDALLDPSWAKQLTSSRPTWHSFCFLGTEQQHRGTTTPAEAGEVVGSCRQPAPQLESRTSPDSPTWSASLGEKHGPQTATAFILKGN